MWNIVTLWERLTDRQKIAFAALGGWCGAWVVGKILDALSAQVPSSTVLSVTAQFILTDIVNGYVGALIAGAMLVGFGPNLWAFIVRLRGSDWATLFVYAIFAVGITFSLWMLGSIFYSSMFDAPDSYVPPSYSLKNANGTARQFTQRSPRNILRIFSDNTSLTAHQIVGGDIGKWMAITGALRDVSVLPMTKQVLVQIGDKDGTRSAALWFDPKWSSKLAKFAKGARIYAVCVFHESGSTEITLESCELAAP
jgi:uncharacterized membrane protein YsdA (DUF1294 family)